MQVGKKKIFQTISDCIRHQMSPTGKYIWQLNRNGKVFGDENVSCQF